MVGYFTFLLTVLLIVGVIVFNYVILTDERWKKDGLLFLFSNKKTYMYFLPLVAILFTIVFLNV